MNAAKPVLLTLRRKTAIRLRYNMETKSLDLRTTILVRLLAETFMQIWLQCGLAVRFVRPV